MLSCIINIYIYIREQYSTQYRISVACTELYYHVILCDTITYTLITRLRCISSKSYKSNFTNKAIYFSSFFVYVLFFFSAWNVRSPMKKGTLRSIGYVFVEHSRAPSDATRLISYRKCREFKFVKRLSMEYFWQFSVQWKSRDLSRCNVNFP